MSRQGTNTNQYNEQICYMDGPSRPILRTMQIFITYIKITRIQLTFRIVVMSSLRLSKVTP